MKRWLLLGVVSLALVGLVGGFKGVPAAHPAVSMFIAGRRVCWPVATTPAQQAEGLQGVRRPRWPLVFLLNTPRAVVFTMHHTPARLTGVWLSTAGRIVGVWHGRPDSDKPIQSRRLVAGVIELPAGQRVPRPGSRIVLYGQCTGRPSL